MCLHHNHLRTLKLVCSTLTAGFVLLVSQMTAADPFSFVVAADMRGYSGTGVYDDSRYFRGVCEAIAATGPGAFMVSPGDVDPPGQVSWTIEQTLGDDYLWYPVVGNHEAETPGDMEWLRSYNVAGEDLPHVVNAGPPGCQETTYSFDYQNAHFVVLNQYYDGVGDTDADGDVVDALYEWLAEDLAATAREHIFIFGHEPAYPQPDANNGRMRHIGDSLDKYPARRDRFWELLTDEGVLAYFCGHTHNYSAIKIDGVWQLDTGHCRGVGDTGAPSTFLIVDVAGDSLDDVMFRVYRDTHDGIYDYNDIVYGWDASPWITLSSFTARQEAGTVVLEWITERERAHRGFVLERRQKEDGCWNEIARYTTNVELVGQEGVSQRMTYKYIDRIIQPGFAYQYRLAVVSSDGRLEHLQTVETRENTGHKIYPDNEL